MEKSSVSLTSFCAKSFLRSDARDGEEGGGKFEDREAESRTERSEGRSEPHERRQESSHEVKPGGEEVSGIW